MNKAIKLVIFITTMTIPLSALSQDSLRYSTASFGLGVNRITFKDQFQSPFTYEGTNAAFHASYSRIKPKSKHEITFFYSGGTIASSISPDADNRHISLSYNYSYLLRNWNGRFFANLGFGLSSFLNSTNYLPFVELSKTNLTGGAALFINPSLSYKINETNKLKVSIGSSLVGLVYRPDFDINNKELLESSSFANNTWLKANIQYEVQVALKYQLLINYQFSYFKFDQPRTAALMQNSVIFGIKKTF
ncbi:MAG: hypothetical protein AAFN93_13440 [Bacteroidota bacterium]